MTTTYLHDGEIAIVDALDMLTTALARCRQGDTASMEVHIDDAHTRLTSYIDGYMNCAIPENTV